VQECGVKLSRESASHWLEILSMCPTDEFLKSRLPTVAGLLLCKQRHQDQAAQICQQWHNHLNHPEARDAIRTSEYSSSSYRPSRRAQVDAQSDGVTARALSSIPQADSPPTSRLSSVRRYSQPVTPIMVRENQIPFHVSSARLAVVSVPRADGHVSSVALRTFRKGLSALRCGM
jgi:hypothetical protein